MAKEKGVEQTINGQLHIENKNIADNAIDILKTHMNLGAIVTEFSLTKSDFVCKQHGLDCHNLYDIKIKIIE